MIRRDFFAGLLGALVVVLYPKPGGPIEPIPTKVPPKWRDRYNDPPDPTLHYQIFS